MQQTLELVIHLCTALYGPAVVTLQARGGKHMSQKKVPYDPKNTLFSDLQEVMVPQHSVPKEDGSKEYGFQGDLSGLLHLGF